MQTSADSGLSTDLCRGIHPLGQCAIQSSSVLLGFQPGKSCASITTIATGSKFVVDLVMAESRILLDCLALMPAHFPTRAVPRSIEHPGLAASMTI